MNPIQNLYYALGEIIYSVAKSDGLIQKEEKKKLHALLEEEFAKFPNEIDVSEIIFTLLSKEKNDPEVTFNWGIKELKTNSAYLSPALKEHFIEIVRKVAEVFPPVTPEEEKFLKTFQNEMALLKADHDLGKTTDPIA